jgi:ABC-type multidrug transport system ATPase subunit
MEEASECDRLAIMADGRVVAQGTLEQIVGDSRTLVVTSPDWAVAFARLDDAGIRAALVGDRLRVPAGEADEASAVLGRIEGITTLVERATLEERFLELTSANPGG